MSITLNLLNISIWIGVSFLAINTINFNTQVGSQTTLIQEKIKSDGTLKTVVSCSSNICDITGGKTDITGRNLFHSFSNFSVPTGGVSYFNNSSNVQNIITRVTGTNVSNIDGIIRSNGTTNFFLINPNGVVISNNASLNTNGTFTYDITNINNSGIIIPKSSETNSQKPSNIALINYGCHMEKGNKFMINNIDGILPNVREAIANENLPLLVAQKPENTLVEATGWRVNEKGQIELIAQKRNVANDNFVLSSCNTY